MKIKRLLKLFLLIFVLFFCSYVTSTYAIYREEKGTTINLTVLDPNAQFTVTFNSMGGSTVSPIQRRYRETLGTLPTPSKTIYVFAGWYTEENGGTKVDENTIVTENVTYYAKWVPVCKRATTLHTAECTRTNGGCFEAGYSASGSEETTTITYGNLGTSGILTSGDAFDCDVNADGIYDPETERFYYVTSEGENAVFIYSANISNNGTTITAPTQTNYAYYASDDENWHGPVTAANQLPNTTQWSNPGLIAPGTRQITNEDGGTTTSGGTIQSFTYTNKAARLLTIQEVSSACGVPVGNGTHGSLDSCNYLFENVERYENGTGSWGYWLETPWASSPSNVWHLDGNGRNISSGNGQTTNATDCGVRPVITIRKSDISYCSSDCSGTYTITLNNEGATSAGTTTIYEKYATGWYSDTAATTFISSITVPTRAGYTFGGYYTGQNGSGTQVIGATGTILSGNTTQFAVNGTLYAKWTIDNPRVPTISGGTTKIYNYEVTTLTCATTANYASGIDIYYEFGYAISSNGETTWLGNPSTTATYSVVKDAYLGTRYYACRVYASDGNATSETVQTTATIPMSLVNARLYFDANGGTTSITNLYVAYEGTNLYTTRTGTEAGTVPTASKTGYTFTGWYTEATGGAQVVSASGVVQQNVSGWTNAQGEWIRTATGDDNTANVLYAQYTPITYTIGYVMNGGVKGTSGPTSANYDETIEVSKPSKTFTVNIDPNSQGATTNAISASSSQIFAGWSASGLDTNNAQYGTSSSAVTTPWSNGETTVGASNDPMYFKNLRSTSGNVALTANWTAVAVTLPNVTKTGYTCNFNTAADGSGDSYNSGASYTPSTTDGSTTLYVRCSQKIYTITLNNQSATSAGTTTIYEKYAIGWYSDSAATTTISSITVPTKTGYTFGGYYTAPDGSGTQVIDAAGTILSSNTQFNANGTLYAKWITYIKFNYGSEDFNGSTSLNSDLRLFSSSMIDTDFEVAVSVNNTQGLWHWYDGRNTIVTCMDESGSPWPGFNYVYDNSNGKYRFEANSTDDHYSRDTEFATNINNIVIKRENRVITFNDVEKLSYSDIQRTFDVPLIFGGTLGDDLNPFRYFRGNLSAMSVKLNYTSGETVDLPVPTKRGYKFIEWNTQPNGGGTSYGNATEITVDRPIELYAIWQGPYTYDVTYNFGNLAFDGSTYLNTKLNLFQSEYFTNDFDISFTVDDFEHMVVHNDEWNTLLSMMDESGSPYPGVVFRNSGYGWNLFADVSTEIRSWVNLGDVQNVNLIRNNNKLYYNNNTPEFVDFSSIEKTFNVPLTFGGALDGSLNPFRYFKGNLSSTTVTVSYFEGETLTLPTPSIVGTDCTFTGWTGDNGTTPQTTVVIPSDNTTNKSYTANFTCNYSIEYNLNGGTANNPTSYTNNSNTITLNNPTRASYQFMGWTGSNDVSSGLYTTSNPYTAGARDHTLANEFAVTAGETYRLFVTAKRTAGTLPMQGGIWYTEQTSGDPWDGSDGEFIKIEDLSDGWARYYKDVTVPAGKTKGRIYILLNQWDNSTVWDLADIHLIQVNTPPTIPSGSTGNKAYTANWMPN